MRKKKIFDFPNLSGNETPSLDQLRLWREMLEIIKQKEVLSISDIQLMFGVSYDKATAVIREIKEISDTLGIVGRIHRQDLDAWLQARKGSTRRSRRLQKQF